jgi:adenosine deaminase
LEIAAPAAGLTAAQVKQAQRNALEIAFLTPTEKATLMASVRQAG